MTAKGRPKTTFVQKLEAVALFCIFVLLLPLLVPMAIIWLVFEKIGTISLYFLLRSNSKKIAICRGTNPADQALVDKEVIPKIHQRVLIFPDDCPSKVMRFLIGKSILRGGPAIYVIKGIFKGQEVNLNRALAKFKKSNRVRLRNLIFKINDSLAEKSGLQVSDANIDEFKGEIIDELVTMIKSQESEESRTYIIPVEDYEEDFRQYKNADFNLVWRFIECWCDEAEHDFQGFYHDIKKNEWPTIAKAIVQSLKDGASMPEDVQKYFGLGKK